MDNPFKYIIEIKLQINICQSGLEDKSQIFQLSDDKNTNISVQSAVTFHSNWL